MEEQRAILAEAGVPLDQLFFDKLSRRQIKERRPEDLKDRAQLVRPTSRTTPEVIYVAAFRVLGWTMGDIADTLSKAARRNASVYAVHSGKHLPLTAGDAAIMDALVEIEADRRHGLYVQQLKAGREATKRRRDRKWERARKIAEPEWHRQSDDPEWKSGKEIAEQVGYSVRTLQNRLGPRREAQRERKRNVRKRA